MSGRFSICTGIRESTQSNWFLRAKLTRGRFFPMAERKYVFVVYFVGHVRLKR